MQFKFYTWASSLLLGVALAPVLSAQSPTPTATPKVGYIRFWNMLPPQSGSFELRKAGSSDPALMNASSYQYSTYTQLPVAKYKLGVFNRNNSSVALKIFDVDLKPDTYFTILVEPKAGTVNADLFEDTLDPKEVSGSVIIRNYFSGLVVNVSATNKPIVDNLPYGQSVQRGEFPLDVTSFTLRTRLPSGVSAESGLEIDFKESKRATILIIPDSYGRFRPRVTYDGLNL